MTQIIVPIIMGSDKDLPYVNKIHNEVRKFKILLLLYLLHHHYQSPLPSCLLSW